MGLERWAYRHVNSALGAAGWMLTPRPEAFKERLVSETLLDRLFTAFSDRCGPWLEAQSIFPTRRPLDVKAEVERFYELYLGTPFRPHSGGSSFNNLLWLYLIARANQPPVAIESGTYTGASAWALRQALPDAPIVSFDIDLSRLILRAPGVEYVESDWSEHDFSGMPLDDGFAYFDDHLDQARRLLESAERGLALAIFDDDFTALNFASMAQHGAALPKVSFVLDAALRHETEIVWLSNGVRESWVVDAAYLDRALAKIEAAERLPVTGDIAGTWQTPFTAVKLRH